MADNSPSLLDQAAADPIGGIMSLLTPVATGGAIAPAQGQLLSQDQESTAVPAWLAFASRLAAAGAPTLGPPVSLGNALVGAMGSGYETAQQAKLLPFLGAAAQREAEQQQLGLQRQEYEFGIERRLGDVTQGLIATLPSVTGGAGAATGAGAGGTSPGAPSVTAPPSPGDTSSLMPGTGPAATQQQLTSSPAFAALPDVSRNAAIMTAMQKGMPLATAEQWARILMHESQGFQMNPADPQSVLKSSAGALGVGQVMPDTFAGMQKKYNIPGTVNDLVPNLNASASYFLEGVPQGFDNATVRYAGGPGLLQKYQATGQLDPDTAKYVSTVRAPGTQFAGPGAPTTGAPAGAPAAGGAGMVTDPLTGVSVPPSVLQSARLALAGAGFQPGNPGAGLNAYRQVINEYQSKAVIQTAPGVQTNTMTGQQSDSPLGAPRTRPMTQPEVEAIPALDGRMAYQVTERPDPANPGQWITTNPGIVPIGPRQAFAQIDQEQKLRTEYQSQQPYTVFNNLSPYLARMRNVLNTATQNGQPLTSADDYILAQNFAHIGNPSGVVKEGEEKAIQDMGGIPADVKAAAARIFGGSQGQFTDAQRQWLMNAAESEAGGSELENYNSALKYRALAQQSGLRPDTVAPLWGLSKWGQQAQASQPPGALTQLPPTGPAYHGPTIPHPGVTSGAALAPPPVVAPPVAPVQAAPGAPGPAPPPVIQPPPGPAPGPAPGPPPAGPPAPATGPPAAKDALVQQQVSGWSRQGVANTLNDMVKNPGRYSAHDREMVLKRGKDLGG